MTNQFSRTLPIFPDGKYEKIIDKKIIVFGTGGVGSAAIESLVRFGFKSIAFVDYDRVDESNLNRQIFTDRKNIGMYKCLAMRDRIIEINPDIQVTYFIKRLGDDIEIFNLHDYDYVIDAIDTITSKINLIEYCNKEKIPLISSMGTGNRLDPCKLSIMDVYETSYDPLSKIMRHELKKRGIKKQKVVSSKEIPPIKSRRLEGGKKSTPFSVSYVPPVAGYMIASEVIKFLTE
ncbi:MAG: tRNA threonylcarbamoyladenosine dehydratase [Tissierellia bacterium]|nr:tRNA threonylcarbamoyladenosine dehydratase [Tissierellia bacterium]